MGGVRGRGRAHGGGVGPGGARGGGAGPTVEGVGPEVERVGPAVEGRGLGGATRGPGEPAPAARDSSVVPAAEARSGARRLSPGPGSCSQPTRQRRRMGPSGGAPGGAAQRCPKASERRGPRYRVGGCGHCTCHSGPLRPCRGQRRGERTTALGRAEALGAVSVDAGSAAPAETAAPRGQAGLSGGHGEGAAQGHRGEGLCSNRSGWRGPSTRRGGCPQGLRTELRASCP